MDTQPQWVMLQEQHDNKDKSRPEHRYSHSASPMGDVMVVTHGYYYGHGGSGPQWLDDTWIFDPAINLWTQVIPRQSPKDHPHSRMSHTAVV